MGLFPKSLFRKWDFPVGLAVGECGLCTLGFLMPAMALLLSRGGLRLTAAPWSSSVGHIEGLRGSNCKEGEMALVTTVISWRHLSEPLFLGK